ncbi:uncharacterized protein LOC131855990 [Cryptomeria japonica]|uniref:uncharacterized protein LOC131855990 n=1 Tax=Cryptomeria japonica TaxID=3369 RepID=UPI0027DAB115|nr:uncharacterized protein LOC131855990 [Cryptomeria japonica]
MANIMLLCLWWPLRQNLRRNQARLRRKENFLEWWGSRTLVEPRKKRKLNLNMPLSEGPREEGDNPLVVDNSTTSEIQKDDTAPSGNTSAQDNRDGVEKKELEKTKIICILAFQKHSDLAISWCYRKLFYSAMEAELVNGNGGEAVSPFGNQVIFEVEQSIDVLRAKKTIKDILLPCNPRFCSIMSEDKHGVLCWVKTEVNVDDHVIVPEFPPGQTEYDEFVNDYICNIHLTPLPKNRPLWQFHFLNYDTSKARSICIINMHHSLGDGTSLMSLLFCCFTRADNPNLPLTFPCSKSVPHKATSPSYSWLSAKYMFHRLLVLMLVLW